MKAALDATICSRRSPCQDVDPDKVFVTGESKGAGMATNLICDTRTSTYFRGASIVSESYPLRSPAGTGLSGQATAPNCPALGGSSNGVGGPPSLNTDISIQWQYGDSDSVGCNIGLPETCYDTGGVTNATDGTHWVWSIPQLAGDNTPPTGQGATSAGTDVAPGHALGCPTAPTSTSHPSTHVFIDTYAGCTVSIRATETVKASEAATPAQVWRTSTRPTSVPRPAGHSS